ncbi:MAG: D-alanyl-D-alanine carboxypeptidase, partial [Pseudomonadota bacterium]|nr:D-alanyl-D-alanine carboxypeptidase [Pseudomonadota bacterium]
RRLILVVNGLASVRQRASEAERLLEWGFRTFDNYDLFKKDEPVEKAAVWLGTADSVPLVLAQDLRLTLPRRVWRKIKLTAVYEGPVTTPIRRGQELGQLRISGPGMPVINRPLLAGRDVDQLSVIKRIGAAISFLVWGE